MVAGLEVLPSLSATVYSMGVGSPVKSASGVKVTSPVVGLTSQVPSLGTVRVVTGFPVGSIKFTVVGSRVPSLSVSLSRGLKVNDEPVEATGLSSLVIGGLTALTVIVEIEGGILALPLTSVAVKSNVRSPSVGSVEVLL